MRCFNIIHRIINDIIQLGINSLMINTSIFPNAAKRPSHMILYNKIII